LKRGKTILNSQLYAVFTKCVGADFGKFLPRGAIVEVGSDRGEGSTVSILKKYNYGGFE
jgi:hypothetical protein